MMSLEPPDGAQRSSFPTSCIIPYRSTRSALPDCAACFDRHRSNHIVRLVAFDFENGRRIASHSLEQREAARAFHQAWLPLRFVFFESLSRKVAPEGQRQFDVVRL